MAHIARKRFGQHFLTAVDVIDRIVKAIAPKPGERLVEIGPGLGAMTIPLRHHCDALTVIELDRDLAELKTELALNLEFLAGSPTLSPYTGWKPMLH